MVRRIEKDQLYTLFLGSLKGKREESFSIRTGIVDFPQQVSIQKFKLLLG
jgi:hypothetical protein